MTRRTFPTRDDAKAFLDKQTTPALNVSADVTVSDLLDGWQEWLRRRGEGVSSLDAQDLRSISFTAIEPEFVSILDDHRVSIADTAFRTSFGELAYSPATLPGTGRALTDADLLAVAVKYSRLGGVRGLYTQLAVQCGGISESRARDLVRRTRQEGFLEATVRGHANHALTEKARQLIRDRQAEEQ